MKRSFATIALTISLAIATPSLAEPTTPQEQASELARQGMEKLMQALQLMITHIPQYEAPIVNEQGDIIIKRKNPSKPRAQPKDKDTPERNI